MLSTSWPRNWKHSAPAARGRTQTSRCQRAGFGQRVEALEDRCLFSTLTVASLQDSGAGSLRAQITAAQSGDTIIFSSTLFSSTTTLSAPLQSGSAKLTGSSKHGHGKPSPPPPTPPPPTPPPTITATITLTGGELLLTRNLTIQGPGAGQLYISGSRAFEVDPTATVTLSGLSIGGSSSGWTSNPWDGYGGGILNHGALTVSACTVSGSIYGAEGGGIFNDGTLILDGSTVSQCVADGGSTRGAGISNWGTATLTNTVISNNTAQPSATLSYPWFNQGGGIFNRGTMTLNGCAVFGNSARTAGGGISNSGTLILNGTTVYGNSAGLGAGVYNAGTMTLKNSSSITDVDSLGVLNRDDTSTIGNLYSIEAFLSPV